MMMMMTILCPRSIMTVDALAGLKYKEKERKGRLGEIREKITREEYTLDWSQSKVFLVNAILNVCCLYATKTWLFKLYASQLPPFLNLLYNRIALLPTVLFSYIQKSYHRRKNIRRKTLCGQRSCVKQTKQGTVDFLVIEGSA